MPAAQTGGLCFFIPEGGVSGIARGGLTNVPSSMVDGLWLPRLVFDERALAQHGTRRAEGGKEEEARISYGHLLP